jgi:hypothetical protein
MKFFKKKKNQDNLFDGIDISKQPNNDEEFVKWITSEDAEMVWGKYFQDKNNPRPGIESYDVVNEAQKIIELEGFSLAMGIEDPSQNEPNI